MFANLFITKIFINVILIHNSLQYNFVGDLSALNKLGTVIHISSQMNIVVKSYFIPKIGKRNIVSDEKKKKIGYVYDIIGSVNKPYILIKPLNKNQNYSNLIGENLYIKKKGKNFKKKQ